MLNISSVGVNLHFMSRICFPNILTFIYKPITVLFSTFQERKWCTNNTLNILYLQLFGVRNTWNGKERSVLFNDSLNTFYLQLYGVRHMVKDHSNIERGNLLPPHGLLFPISSKGYFICIIQQTG